MGHGDFKPVVIVGAPRSGTNMLRDVLTSFDGICTWPCDEINYIWRHGNVKHPSDEIPANKVTPSIKKYIRSKFSAISKEYNSPMVIEKTCANSLRVDFVKEVLPDAKYIFIYRDGIDATGSAKLRWTAKLDIPYILEKVRYVPKSDLPYYALRYLWARVYRFFSKDSRLAFWGPALDDMQETLEAHSLNEVCALQWQRCVDKSEAELSKFSEDQVVRVKYEDFVTEPSRELAKILDFLEVDLPEEVIAESVSGVSNKSLGKGRVALGVEDVKGLEELVGETLKRYGYL
ncbi:MULTISPECIES: sulfotransferase [unclassified Oleiphilus]|uniref:sulfotransferase family protein n=1 Tax=unclassified Oleiphilus TaxID=2631174 RepID=UPI000AF5C3E6|nr:MULTISPECIES: sulfotransferase [unclassified Oleiphilus]